MANNEYLSRGVSADKEEVHAAVKNQDKGVFPGAFCKLNEDPCGDRDYCASMHADGAGTKSSLAYVKYKETGDVSVFRDLAQDSCVMNLDDLLCVGAKGPFLVSNTIGRNAHRVGGEAIAEVIRGYNLFAEKMAQFGIELVLSGGETADVGDLVSTLIVDSTFFVRMKRAEVIDNDNIRPGDVIVGFASYGQAIYEDKYNAGMGSNGLTAARHLVFSPYYREKYPESYSNTIDKSLVYCGKRKLEDNLPDTDITVGEAVLSPTRTYAPLVIKLLEEAKGDLHGLIHCTGGGQTKCRNFGKNIHYLKENLFDAPLFRMIEKDSGMDKKEMYKVFNMGHRLEAFLSPTAAKGAIMLAANLGIEAKIVGYTEKADGINRVTITDGANRYNY